MISSARLGDRHVCPMPGHGTTPIASASANVNINFMGSARVGDVCGCGAVITTGFPSIQVNGRPMAHLGSPTSHGGTIITGSSDVGGGFIMGVPPGTAIINFAVLGAIRPDGTFDDERMATLLADPDLTKKATAANALVDPNGPKQEKTEPVVCNDPDQMEGLTSYIAGEMNRNINDPSVLEMKRLIQYDPDVAAKQFAELPLLARLGGPPNFGDIAKAHKVSAVTIWTQKVGQNKEWDHKPKLRRLFPGVRHKQGQYDYYYDIWSNIHYGYVGTISGLADSILLDGAGAEQIVSDFVRKADEMWEKPKTDWQLPGPHLTASLSDGLRAFDDVADRVSISIGVKLAHQHPHGGITAKIIMDEVLAVAPENWGEGISVHVCR